MNDDLEVMLDLRRGDRVSGEASLLVVFIKDGKQRWCLYAGGEKEFMSDEGQDPLEIYLKAWIKVDYSEKLMSQERWEIVKVEPTVLVKEVE